MIKTIRTIAEYISENVHNKASTLSNIAFIWFGFQLLYVNILFGLLMIGVGIGSTGFHWHRNDCWHKADIVMIYYMFSVLASWLWFQAPGIVLGLTIGFILHDTFNKWSRFSWQIIGTLGALTLLPFWMMVGWTGVYPVLIWFGLAFATSTIATRLDPTESKKTYDAFHAIWHIFSATGIYEIIYRASEHLLNLHISVVHF